MKKNAVEWLYGQLPDLVEKGIISSDAADRIRDYYGPVPQEEKRSYMTIFGIIGTILVGLGIILILAHNWEQLNRFNRMVIAVVMLVIAQICAAIVWWFKQDTRTWKEGAAVFWMLMMGASMALVSQTYHLSDDTGTFLLAWMLLSLPILYLLQSTIVAAIYLIGIGGWVANGSVPIIGKHLIWLLFGAIIPYCRQLLLTEQSVNAATIVTWIFTLSFYFSFADAFNHHIGHFGLLLFAALFSITYLLGLLAIEKRALGWYKALLTIGAVGTVGISFILTFRDVWSGFSFGSLRAGESLLAILLLLAVAYLGYLLVIRKMSGSIAYIAAPFVAGAGYLLQAYDTGGLSSAVLMNLFLLSFSMYMIRKGVRKGELSTMNMGMLLLGALIIARFLDINFSFVVRGIVFLALGICFLVVNWMAARRKAGANDAEQ